ncbi:MAG TPA: DUF971 domain-containing protein [Beijerinckiaceae bacterium]|nr:DUF971 domain-containing protein [Beijerinckiaceae bacterium]
MDADQKVDPWPTEIRVSADRRALTVGFEGGDVFTLAAEFLRVMSPSAEVQGHTPEQKKTVPGKRDVVILKVEPVGNYAVRIVFDDLHDSGIYGWRLLRRYGREQTALWQAYLDDLAARGMTRDPARRAP